MVTLPTQEKEQSDSCKMVRQERSGGTDNTQALNVEDYVHTESKKTTVGIADYNTQWGVWTTVTK